MGDPLLVATLTPGTAARLAARLRQLVSYGAGYNPPGDSVLADTMAGALRYAAYLESSGGTDVLKPGDALFETSDGLAQQIVDEVQSGAYGTPTPPPAEPGSSSGISTGVVVALGGLAAVGLLFALSGGRR